MNTEKYLEISKRNIPKEEYAKNAIVSFFVGGLVGLLAQGLNILFTSYFSIDKTLSITLVVLFFIVTSCILTALGVMDNLVKKYKCGLIIPITGFAHAVSSCMIDFKHEGLITGIGANTFKLAGSVILYATVSGFLVGLVYFILGAL